jgi:hypothetical protein
MVPIPHTVIDVRTVMIKSLNAKIANVAMSASRSSDDLAFRAHVKRVAFVKKILKIY